MRALLAVIALLIGTLSAAAQSTCPPIITGAILTAAQWQSCFTSKMDNLGYIPLNPNGGTMTGRFVAAGPVGSLGGFNITPSVAPSGPANGDLWSTTTGWYGRAGGQTFWLSQPPGRINFTVSVDFNTGTADTAIPISLPPGYTRYIVEAVRISGASHDISTATAGVFTATAGGGVAIVTAASSITVTATADATNNNTQAMTVNDADTRSYLLAGQPTLYFRVGTAEGSAATANVTISVSPLP
jgi:hypothetical protein